MGNNFTLLRDISGLWLPPQSGNVPVKGKMLSNQNLLSEAFLLIEDGKIVSFGPMSELKNLVAESIVENAMAISCNNRYVLPAFVDAHSHLVFAAWRENEMEMRLQGATYLEIAAQGGGILNSALKMETADENQLFDQAWERLQALMRLGTGALEIKSGYGLSLESELKMLRVIRRIREKSPIPIKATFLGAHAVPKRFQHRDEYIKLVINEMIPAVAAESLADYCDVFCDTGFFTPDETEKILIQGLKYGLKAKVHANELARSGGVQVGVKLGAVSVDHLECVEDEELNILSNSSTIPVLLPGTAFFLGIHPPPARKMIEAGLPVALSSDYNPGTCPSGNMELLLSMTATMLKLQVSESIHAATINSALAMEVLDHAGKIEIGRDCNVLITKPIPSLAFMPYHFGESSIEQVLIKGKRV